MERESMDKLVDLQALMSWSKEIEDDEDDEDYEFEDEENFDIVGDTTDGTYQANDEVNGKIIVWQGSITLLQVDAIVNNTNETLSDRTEISGFIHDVAGHELEHECMKHGRCAPGDAKTTKSGKIEERGGAKFVIHTVAPDWKDDSSSDRDPEAVLKQCYHSVIQQAKAHHAKTIAFSVLKRKDYPRERAVHICCEELRYLLEKEPWITTIVLVFRQNDVYDQMIYEIVLPLYFPRNKGEEIASKEHLKKYRDVWKSEKKVADAEKTGLANMAQALNMGGGGQDDSVQPSHEESLHDMVLQSHQEEFDDIKGLELIFNAGKDAKGNPVVFFIEAHLPNKKQLLDRVLMYIIRVLDEVADSEYGLVYVSRLSAPEYIPDFAWFKKAHTLFDRRFKKNLKQLFLVHPSFWFKATLAMCRPFISAKFYDKITYVEKLPDLFEFFQRGSLYLPDTPSVRLYMEGEELPAINTFKSAKDGKGPPTQDEVKLASANAHMEQQLKDANTKLELATAAKDNLSKELVHMANQLAALQKQKEEAVARLKAEREGLLQEKEVLSAKVTDVNASNDQVQHAQGVISQLEDQLLQAEKQRDELARELLDISEQLEQALTYNRMISKELLQEADEIRKGKLALIGRMAQLEVAVETAEAHVEILKEELREVEDKNLEMKRFFADQFAELQKKIAEVEANARAAILAAEESRDKVFAQVTKQLSDSKNEQHGIQDQMEKMAAEKEELLDLIRKLQDKLRTAKDEAENKSIGVDLSEVEKMIQDAESGVDAIERKLNEDVTVDPQAAQTKAELRAEIDLLMEKLVIAPESQKEALTSQIHALESLLASGSQSENQGKEVLEMDPRAFELSMGTALLRLQQKTFQVVKIMQLAAASPLQKAFLQWQAFVLFDKAEEQYQAVLRREEQLRREKTKLNTKMRMVEDDAETLNAETQHLKKKLRDSEQVRGAQADRIKQLEDLIKKERTRHMAKMEEALGQMEEDKDKLMDDNSALLETIQNLRGQVDKLEREKEEEDQQVSEGEESEGEQADSQQPPPQSTRSQQQEQAEEKDSQRSGEEEEEKDEPSSPPPAEPVA